MTAFISPPPRLQFFTTAGVPMASGLLYTYAAGTNTPLVTYTDSTGLTANTNPVILDSRGEASIWLGGVAYKFKLATPVNVNVWTQDNITSGWSTPTANLPMGGFKFTGAGAGVATTDFATYGQLQNFVQNSTGTLLTAVAGTNTITATLTNLAAYAEGQVFTLIPAVTNTGAVTLNINSLGAVAVTKGGATALSAGEFVVGAAYQLVYDGTRFLISNSPGRILQTSYYTDAGNGPGGTISVNPTYVNASSALWAITPISATSVLVFNISMQLQIGIVALTNTTGFCNIYEGTAATPTTASGRYTYATTATIGAGSASTAVFTFQLSSGSTTARNYGVSAATSNAGTACVVQNITGTCMEIQL